MQIHIRKIDREDLRVVLEIEWMAGAYWDNDLNLWLVDKCCWSKPGLEKFLEGKGAGALVAQVDKKVVGYLAFQAIKRGYDIIALVVHPESRRQGVGVALLASLYEKALNSDDKKWLRAPVHETDVPSLEFFKSCGFTSKLIRNCFPCGADGVEFKYLVPEQVELEEEEEEENDRGQTN